MNNDGYMLVELILSIALAGLVVATCLEVSVTNMRGSQKAQNIDDAINLCEERLEQVKRLALLRPGQGSNPDSPAQSPFLPALSDVSIDGYDGFYLTESDYYNSVDPSVPGSLTALRPQAQLDRITQIEGLDDLPLGDGPDYFKVTVSVFWKEGSFAVTTYVTAK